MNPLLVAFMALGVYVAALIGVRAASDPGVAAASGRPGGAHEALGSGASPFVSRYDRASRRLAPAGRRLFGQWYGERLRVQLVLAGTPKGFTASQLLGRKLILMGTLGTAGVLVLATGGSRLAGLAMLVIAVGFHDFWLANLASARQAEVEKELPDLLDVLAVTVSGGTAFRPALGRVALLTRGALAEEVGTALREMDFGVARRRAFENLRTRNARSESMATFVTGVLQAEELGVPLVDALVTLTTDMRRDQEQTLRRRVARVEARITAVMTLMVLPASVVLIVVGLFLGSDFDFGGVLGG